MQEALAPRAARNTKSYAEHEQPRKSAKNRKSGIDTRERMHKRSSKAVDMFSHSLPMIEGAAAQVRDWSFGSLPKKDASHFVRAVNLSSFVNFHFLLGFTLLKVMRMPISSWML